MLQEQLDVISKTAWEVGTFSHKKSLELARGSHTSQTASDIAKNRAEYGEPSLPDSPITESGTV